MESVAALSQGFSGALERYCRTGNGGQVSKFQVSSFGFQGLTKDFKFQGKNRLVGFET
jgi:hypothetical protein